MQHIHQHLQPLSQKRKNRKSFNGTEEASQGLDEFQYRRLFFGDLPPSNSTTQTAALNNRGGIIGTNRALLPSLAIGKEFLQCFLVGEFHFLPFLNAEKLQENLLILYDFEHFHGIISASGHVMLMIALAIGGTSTEHSQYVEAIFEQAQAAAGVFSDVVSTESVQIAVMLICTSMLQSQDCRVNIISSSTPIISLFWVVPTPLIYLLALLVGKPLQQASIKKDTHPKVNIRRSKVRPFGAFTFGNGSFSILTPMHLRSNYSHQGTIV